LPLVAINEVVPVRDLIVDRATRVAIGNAAIHAACGLFLGFRLRQRPHELAPMLDALFDRLVVAGPPPPFPTTRGPSPSPSASPPLPPSAPPAAGRPRAGPRPA